MELMPCQMCKGRPREAWMRGVDFTTLECDCDGSGLFHDESHYYRMKAGLHWNVLQTKLARLEYLEAMLKSDEPEQTKGRL
ncbi:hypothetical protein [Massilia sp. NP310]|uniref:hypothetical protein n=1 Tax=Massilia sp. NP310 TaxID=2861282 RepID=UPI001C628BA3|nr:hypothetical protein [Massilia sp. NP310]QYG03988.1 hypothetical protein KY496_11720 [Massilia sp. NP310]